MTGTGAVRDYRFVGADLSFINLMRAGMSQDRRFGEIITYHWLGRFPDTAEAVQMFEAQHPGGPLPTLGSA